MSARRNLVFLLPLGLFMGIAVTACSLVAGLEDNVEIETGGGGAGASEGGGAGGMGGIGVGVGGACDSDGGLLPTPLVLGFMDSRDVPCSDGTKLVDCTCVPTGLHGQDAEYLGLTPTFLPDVLNQVKEVGTGLLWWTIPTPNKSFKDAQAVCAGLGSGYRLPTRLELWTIIEHNQAGATLLDENVFKGIEPGIAWTSTSYVHLGHPDTDHWVIDLCSKCATSSRSGGLHESNGATALCVNGNEVKNGPFTDQANGTLLDTTTHLVWMAQVNTTGFSWQEALDYCESSFFLQKTDWRLPTIKELQTIMDETKTGDSSLQGGFMIGNNQPVLWSSTPDWTGAMFYQLSSAGGSTARGNETYMAATCVRHED